MQAPHHAPELIAHSLPDSVFAGERVTVFGGLSVPEGRFEIGMYNCQFGACQRSSQRQIEGPSQLWIGFGAMQFDFAGVLAEVQIRIFEADRLAERVLGTWVKSIDVQAVDDDTSGVAGVIAKELLVAPDFLKDSGP